MTDHLKAFRLGDVRGIYPTDIDADFAERFAQAFAIHFALEGKVAVGRDMRDSSIALQDGLHKGFNEAGLDVVDLGLCATELGYFASSMPDIEAVVVITASHNPAQYNGFKCVLQGGKGIHFGNGLKDVMQLMLKRAKRQVSQKGKVLSRDYQRDYIEFLKQRFSIRPGLGSIALNGLNGTASTLAADIAGAFELSTSWFRKEPGPFPRDGADPVNPRLRKQMTEFMGSQDFCLGVAWDGDCDRCVFFDGQGCYIPAYYIVGILADHILEQTGPAPIVFDTKVYWNLKEVIERRSATPIPSKTGHSFMKQNMKHSGAVYGGEQSSHHYFGDFFACDSGMYAWLKMAELISRSPRPLGELVEERRALFKCTPEISLKLQDLDRAMGELEQVYGASAANIERLDGLAFDMGSWRFSVKESKTEPFVRINMESRSTAANLIENGGRLLEFFESFRADDQDWLTGLAID